MRHVTGLCAVAVVAALAAACAPAPPPPPPDTRAADTAAINKLRADYQAAWEAGDADKLGTLVTEDAIQYQNGEPTFVGRAAGIAFNKQNFAGMTPARFAIKSEEMKLAGDWAFDRGTLEIEFTPKAPGAKPVTAQLRYIVILRRDTDGAWRLSRGIDNSPAPMPPMPPMPAGKGK